MRLGIASRHSNVQEAAIMVCEEWRTKACLDTIHEADFHSKWMKKYADKVAEELKVELTGP